MLVIRSQQLEAIRLAMLAAFENEMVLHSKEFAPKLCEVIGEEQLRVALRRAMGKAGGYGFTNRGPMRLYIELMFLCGSDFDTDPQYPGLSALLRAAGDQMVRAEKIHEGVLDYQEKVSGPDAVNEGQSLEAMLVFARKTLKFSSKEFVPGMLQELTGIFPQKAAYIGEQGLTALIHTAFAKALEYGFSTIRGQRLLVAMMFGFGHGCTDDPLYPWIGRTLKDDRIVDPAARADRLERKVVTWLEHVVASNGEGART